jgi:hypothetical protein
MLLEEIQYIRPEKIRNYKKQVEFLDSRSRFTVVEATSKAGKTVGCIVWLFEQAIAPAANFIPGYSNLYVGEDGNLHNYSRDTILKDKEGLNYWWIAPTYKVAKIAFRRFKKYIDQKDCFQANESELTITLFNGAIIFFKSGQDADALYGEDVHAAVIDEATRIGEDSWIAIFSTLTATEGLCKIIGNVKGNTNWVYKLAREAEAGKENWSYYKITAADAVLAGILKQKVIDEAERTLPKGIFLELFYGIPFVNSSNKFAFAFDKSKHVHKCEINYNYHIYLSFDFNKNPISCGIYQWYDGKVFCPLVIKLENSNIYKLCEYIKNKFTIPGYGYNPDIFIINGDASGNAGSALVPDDQNYFTIIKAELDLASSQMQQLHNNPKIVDNQVLVNAVLEHMPCSFDPHGAAPLIFDLQFVEMLPDGKMKKADREHPEQQADALDTWRYFVNRNLRDFLKGYRNQT